MQCTIKLIHTNGITLQIVNAMLQIENLEFSYHKKGDPIFNGINLTIQPGSVYGLLGKNGIGKSTLLYMMCGLMFPHKGSIRFDGIEVGIKHTVSTDIIVDRYGREIKFFGHKENFL